MKRVIVIQAAAHNWSGGPSRCLRRMKDGRTALEHTIESCQFGGIDEVIVASADPIDGVEAFVGEKENPLLRVYKAAQDADIIVRVDAEHPAAQFEHLGAMIDLLGAVDGVKFPDDWPPQLAFEVYNRAGLERIVKDQRHYLNAHFRYHPDLEMRRFNPPEPDEDALRNIREYLAPIYKIGRDDIVPGKRVATADMLGWHYEQARRWLQPDMMLLDIGCGSGQGCAMMYDAVNNVVGADIDEQLISRNIEWNRQPKISFEVADATAMPFLDGQFEAVTAFELIEHINARAFFYEVNRVLSSGGVFILSTPQNRLGAVPLNVSHKREYSMHELFDLCLEHFEVPEFRALKAGTIEAGDDRIGSNSFVVCRKR